MNKLTEEMSNVIYDTLMENTNHRQFDVMSVGECEVGENIITFDYEGINYKLTIEENK